jgi:serine-type D-Ala-D-Ala carboxypeptidase (penicillin-binding protein 5/6)
MVSVSDLIRGITVQSGNDAAIILAEGISGTEDAFVKQMNDYAKEIGLTKSHFVNSSGLSAEGQLMTAREARPRLITRRSKLSLKMAMPSM